MNKTKDLLSMLSISLLLVSLHCFADDTKPQYIATGNKDFAIILPVSETESKQVHLIVTVPAQYRSLQSLEELQAIKMQLMEFIPEKDNDYAWNAIITLNTFVGSQLKASDITQSIKQRFGEGPTHVDFIEDKTTEHEGYQQSCLGVDYEINHRHEMVYMCFYSGDLDSAGMQYAMLWPQDSQITKQQMQKQLMQFVDAHSKIVTTD